MSKFKLNNFKIDGEPKSLNQNSVRDLDKKATPDVQPFGFQQFNKFEKDSYSTVKSKYGPLAVTDVERNARNQKDRRFSLNPLLKEPLSIEAEERRVLDEKVKDRIQAIAEEAKKNAFAVGYEEGSKKGYEEAFKRVHAEGIASLKQLDSLILEGEKAKEEIFQANERFLIELVFRIAKMLFLKELAVDRDYVLRLAKELIGKVGVRDNIKLKINSSDAQLINSMTEGLEKTYGKLNNLNIEVSTNVSPGGCQVETEWNAIEANIDSQLQGVYESIFSNKSGN